MRHLFLAFPVASGLILAALAPATAHGLETVQIAPGIHAIVGPLSQRDPENLGDNATFGLVVTDDGAVLIDPGGSYLGAQKLDSAVHRITDAPVVAVIDTGGQDHRWIGNGYWAERGAQVYATDAAVADQKARASVQMTALAALIGQDGLAGTEPVFADHLITGATALNIGGVAFELIPGPAHTPGDMSVWLPAARVVFTGDLVFSQRMLGVLDVSSSKDWMASFENMAALGPAVVVPGHGFPTDLTTARADTYDVLANLRRQIGDLLANGGDILDAPKIDQSAFGGLANFDTLAGRNAQAVFTEMEWE